VPVLTVIAGPNGSGKSTFTSRLTTEAKANLLDPDAVAKRIDPADPTRAAIAAAREVITRTREYLDRGESFALETTLAGRNYLDVMAEAKLRGFNVRLIYICLDLPERNVQRVSERVLRGGHFVPDLDVKRRYERSLANLPAALRIAHDAVAYDNSDRHPVKVFEARNGTITWRSPKLPAWASSLTAP
jgi:predicted ABC-type ATPase